MKAQWQVSTIPLLYDRSASWAQSIHPLQPPVEESRRRSKNVMSWTSETSRLESSGNGTNMVPMVHLNLLFPTKTKGRQAGCKTGQDSERAGLLSEIMDTNKMLPGYEYSLQRGSVPDSLAAGRQGMERDPLCIASWGKCFGLGDRRAI